MTPGSHAPIHVADFPGIQYAACASSNADLWFPERGDGQAIRNAKRICNTCPVKQQCLEYAIENHENWGVWGGATPQERGHIRRRRNRP